jgi:hypothetical protein
MRLQLPEIYHRTECKHHGLQRVVEPIEVIPDDLWRLSCGCDVKRQSEADVVVSFSESWTEQSLTKEQAEQVYALERAIWRTVAEHAGLEVEEA